jgi:hypothetical protein
MLSRTKIILVLILSYDWSRRNGVLAILTFVDHSLSLIISFLDSQASFALTTTNTCSLNLQAPYSCLTPWGWPDNLEHSSRIPLYKSFYEQVFFKVQQKSTRKPLKHWKRYIPTSRKAGVFKAPSRRSYKICRQRIFFPMSRLTQERRKIEYWWATYKKSIRFAVKFFVLWVAQFKKAKDFYTTSYLQGQRSVCPKPRILFFLVHKYWGSEATHLGWSIGSYETSSMRKPCAKAGHLYAAKAVP